jgi:hypothetical protein
MNTSENPPWWGPDQDFAWDHVKRAMERDLNTKQAKGWNSFHPWSQPSFGEFEPAYRFGHGARLHFWAEHPEWTGVLERLLRQDWHALFPMRTPLWEQDRKAIRYGWGFEAEAFNNRVQFESCVGI